MLSGPDEYDIALTLTSLYRQNMSGLLTVYHVDGVDALQMSFNSPFKAAERLADKIAEPVQLVIGSYLLGNVFQLRLPGNFKPREDYVTSHILESLETPPEGMWFPAYNHGYDEETWKEARP